LACRKPSHLIPLPGCLVFLPRTPSSHSPRMGL
jgi:hypothetical protein